MFTQPESHSRVPSGPITPILNQVAICSLTSSNDIYSHHDLSNVILPQLNLPISPNPEDLDASKRSSAAPTLRGLDPVTTPLGNALPVVKRELRHKVDMAEPTDLIVSWDGHDDPENPKKCVLRLIHAFQIVMNLPCSWSIRRKWMATVMVASRLSELKASWIFTDKLSNLSFSHSQSHIHLTQSQLTSSHRASPIPSGLLPPRSHSRADSTPRDPFSMANNASASNINKRHASPSKVSSSAQFPNPLFDVIWLSGELQPATGRTYDARLASREMHLLGNLPHLPTHLPTSLAASPSTLYLLTTASYSALPNTSSGKDNSWGSLSYLASYDALNRSEDFSTLVRCHIHQSFRSHYPRHYQRWRTMYQN